MGYLKGDSDWTGEVRSPGGHVFGLQGFQFADPIVCALTFYLDNTCEVHDQYGRPVRGVITKDNKTVLFAPDPPNADRGNDAYRGPHKYATHMETVIALEGENIDWRKLPFAGTPQLDLERLQSIKDRLPEGVPIEQLHKIKSPELRAAALRVRLELDQSYNDRKLREEKQAQTEYETALAAAKQQREQDEVARLAAANGSGATTATAAPAVKVKK